MMRAKFPDLVERGRIRHAVAHLPGTQTGDTFGMFVFRHPRTSRRFKVIVGDGDGWDHVSVSTKHRPPTWGEMCWIKGLFFDPAECVIQYHPPAADYVNLEPNCLHLWRPHDGGIPMPPTIMV